MRPGREAVTLPLIFLSVALMGGFRSSLAGGMRFLAPELSYLVLALFILGVAFRSGLLLPHLLISHRRTPLENASGSIVLVTLFLASAQIVNSLAPEEGLFHLLYCLFFAVLLWNTLAARPDRQRLLQSLFVILSAALIFKYVLLAGLYAPQGGLVRRVVAALLEGVALGTLRYQPWAPATGYVAFCAVLLYLAGLMMLPAGPAPAALVPAGAGGDDTPLARGIPIVDHSEDVSRDLGREWGITTNMAITLIPGSHRHHAAAEAAGSLRRLHRPAAA